MFLAMLTCVALWDFTHALCIVHAGKPHKPTNAVRTLHTDLRLLQVTNFTGFTVYVEFSAHVEMSQLQKTKTFNVSLVFPQYVSNWPILDYILLECFILKIAV